MNHARRALPPLLLAAALAAPAAGQSASDTLLDPPFQSRVEGVEFRPPVGGTIQRQLNSGEVVRFQYPDHGWTLVLKDAPNSAHLPMTVPPTAGPTTAPALGGVVPRGLLDLAVDQMTADRGGKPAEVLRKDVVPLGPRSVGLIEAHDDVGTDRKLVQVALIPDGLHRYFILQMIGPAGADAVARDAFQRSLATVTLLDRAAFRQEQDRRQANTRLLWVQVDRKRVEAALQPVHFMRVVRDGRDVGYVQVDERVERLDRRRLDGLYVVTRQHALTAAASSAAAAPVAAAPLATPGVDVPQPRQAAAATQLDREARFFCTFDRAHETWSAQTRLDNRPGHDLLELGSSDTIVRRRLDPASAAGRQPFPRRGGQPPMVDVPVDTLRVDNYRGATATAAPYEARLDFRYLTQAWAQLLPRLLPADQPKQYLFAFYVAEERQLLARYVDVGEERTVTLDGQRVRAVPISDRIGADGVVTTHYVSRDDGQWLGTTSDDGRLLVLPTDAESLQKAWPGFAVLPPPGPIVEQDLAPDDRRRISADDLKVPPAADPGAAGPQPPAVPQGPTVPFDSGRSPGR